jgi:2-dehydro-3-deoxyphosphogluconate aldolase/(4S)-4-hydroxy-2-oxoglutarate aldolase
MTMSRLQRLEVLNAIVDTGLVPVFYHSEASVCMQIVEACVAGGARVVEFTNRGDFAPFIFREVAEHFAQAGTAVSLGVGSIVDPHTAALYLASGASFVVGPVLNPDVARLCNRRKVAYSPGCATASEISQAEELGVEIVKLFPGGLVGGPAFVRSILAPCPWTKIMPTGGVETTPESIGAWFKAGVAAVGIGSNLITREHVAAGNFQAIAEATAQVLRWIRDARGSARAT